MLIILALATVAAVKAEECGVAYADNKIVGGYDAGGYHYPWFALLKLRIVSRKPPVCAGTLISPKHVLTAAHCFSITPKGVPKEELFEVELGTYNRCAANEPHREVFNVKAVYVHEKYKPQRKFFDITIMTLDGSSTATPVCLPPPGKVTQAVQGLLVGFGVTRQGNTVLPCRQRYANVMRLTPEQCSKTALPKEDYQEPTVFCGGGQKVDSCQGDSGGGFLTSMPDGRYMVSGIVSYGYGCALEDLPGIYTDVASYLDWIHSKTSLGSGPSPSETSGVGGFSLTVDASPFKPSLPLFSAHQARASSLGSPFHRDVPSSPIASGSERHAPRGSFVPVVYHN